MFERMRSRKLVRIGSSLFVSIPAEWARSLGLSEGSEVLMDMDGEGITLRPPRGAAGRRVSVGPPAVHRKLLAAYLNGCSEIEVSLSGVGRGDMEKLERVASSLIGLEKVYQGSDRAVYACFVDDNQDAGSISGRMVDTLSGMLVDAARALDSVDRGGLEEVAERDAVIDKLYFLLVRVLRSTVELPRAKLMDFRAMSKVLERIGDEVSGLASGAPESWNPTSLWAYASEEADMLRKAHSMFLEGRHEDAEALGEEAWSLSCELLAEAAREPGDFGARAAHAYSAVAGLIKDVTDLIV
ncbi:MAG: phosphate uptake regulator PhoU [Nitrososphaeria archaeon]